MSTDKYAVERANADGFEVFILQDIKKQTTAKIIPELGNNCYSLTQIIEAKPIDIIKSPPDLKTLAQRPSGYGNPVLFPFPNRIRQGNFSFEGKPYSFDKTSDSPNSIHGLVIDQPFDVDSTSTDNGAVIACSLNSADYPHIERQFPFTFQLKITYELKAAKLTMATEVSNLSDQNMPMGYGIHPYFSIPFSKKSSMKNCHIFVPAKKYWELDQFLPTGQIHDVNETSDLRTGKPFSEIKFDDVFTDLTLVDGTSRCIIDDRDTGIKMILEADEQFRELVVYTPPDRASICFEPYTCPTDAINLQEKGIDAGLIILKPGQTFSSRICIYIQGQNNSEEIPQTSSYKNLNSSSSN